MLGEIRQLHVAAEALAIFDRDAAERQDEIDFGLGEILRRLVSCNAEFVETTRLFACLIDRDVMAEEAEAMRGRETCRTSADDSDLFARRRSALEWLDAFFHQRVGRVALQEADLDRLALGGIADAGLFAQRFGRADAGAHAAHYITRQDCLRRADRVLVGDLADEERNVDRGRAGRDAGRVIAIKATLGGDARLECIERRVDVEKILGQCRGRQTAARNIR